jgi:RNA polymerase sigma factor (sigma-70 family)
MSGRLGTDSRFLETLFSAGTACGLTDAQLLERFVSGHDETKEAAFEGLVLRHGSMVFDICRKILDNTHDAQDAFLATFLILATRARSIIRRGSVGSWLHGVALRVARRARSDAARRNVQERQLAELKRWDIEPNTMDNGHDLEVLHDEVERLPRKYREAVVLCYLEGMNLEAAAGQLGCPIGTLGVRLMRAKERLKIRLTRRGMSVPAGVLVAGISESPASAALPATLVGTTVNSVMHKSSSGVVSLAVAKLTSDVLGSMVMVKLVKAFAGIMVTFVALFFFDRIVVHSGMLHASSRQNPTPKQSPASWIGQRVVTKYGAPIEAENRDAARLYRIFVVKEEKGERVRLVSDDTAGWIDSSKIVLFDDAIDFYAKDLLANPNNVEAYSHRGWIWACLHEREKALADFTEAIRLGPKQSSVYMNRGNFFSEQSESDKAIADYTEAIRLDPKWGAPYYQRGSLWDQKGSNDKVISDFTEAIQFGAKDGYAYRTRGLAWLNKHDYDKSISDLSEAVTLGPKDVLARYNRGRAWLEKLALRDVLDYRRRGRAWPKRQKFDEAIADYDEVIRLDPGSVNASRDRGFCRHRQGDFDEAISDFTQAIHLDPNSAEVFSWRAQVWSDSEVFDKAIADYDKAIQLEPMSANYYNDRGCVWAMKDEFRKSIVDFDDAIKLDPKYMLAYYNRGRSFHAEKDYDKALADFDEAIRLNAKAGHAYLNRGQAWMKKRDYDKAIADFDEAIRLNPLDVDSRFCRGLAWRAKKEYANAIADFDEALGMDAQDPGPYDARAWIWATCPDAKYRDGKRAVESATRACELTQRKDSDFLATLAAACAETRDFESAVKWQVKANDLLDAEDKIIGESRLQQYREKKPYRDDNL